MNKASSIKQIAKAHNYIINSNRKFRLEYIYIFGILFGLVLTIIFGFRKPKEFEKGQYLIISQCSIFMNLGYYLVSLIPSFLTTNKQRYSAKGSASIGDTFSQFPITIQQCIKYSFYKWVKISLFMIIGWSIVCFQSIFIHNIEKNKGEIGFITFLVIFIQIFALYCSVFNYKKSMKFRRICSYILITFMIMLLPLLMVLYNFSFIYNIIKCFKVFSGPIGIACLYIYVPVMYLIGKIFVFNKNELEAWSNE